MSAKSRRIRVGGFDSTEVSKVRDSTIILVRRLTIGSAILVLLLGSSALVAIRIQSNQVEKLNRSIDPAVNANNLVLAAMNDEYTQYLQIQSLSEISVPNNFAEGRRRTIGELVELEQKLRDLFGQTSGKATDAEELESRQANAVARWQEFVQATEQGTIESNFSSALHGHELFDNFRNANIAIHNQIATERDRRFQLSEKFTTWRQFVVIGLTLFGVMAMLFVGSRYARAISGAVADEHQKYLQNYIGKLENLDRQKSNFVATVSHELRTPLTSITGYLELLKDGYAGTISDEQQQMLNVMDRNSNRLRALIENLLDLNRSENMWSDTESVGVSIGELVTKTCEEYFPLAQSRGITFEIELGSELAFVTGARGQLQRAIGNIVSNAIKFSLPYGVVTVICVVEKETRMVRISIQDRGIGIPATDQSNLFTRFFRAGNAIERHIPGTGLGLSIVESIVRDHGGHIRLASTDGLGTTVVIDLPLAPE